ncbi:MAG: putative DNA binding domain-containing protein [Lactobacillus sp.]|jgi:ATP-dependent DNA helicase RecG|nr:putative DNA binding domain-containing protein [Lactobacillus sp.]MCH3905686.1 putative DNA binding domain-containing protein [Lactobacillus sp.]MCH3990745.1 putative DNA binding domain-containing protein [Lactobacillus sp.]MCH4068539.1 putative DNA binding domain-containing protein [Lactobacillus sp.]MCI1304166.1 putative DNA binding domain-containing protein [Lactobacillus sp.]
MRETRNLEFKTELTNTFLKTVSAYANYGTGEVKFGIQYDGTIIGIKNPKQACLQIENKINDAISPNPDYILTIDSETNVVTLRVSQGDNPPYLYKSKAYKRNDSSTVPVDTRELSRLILLGENKTYDSLPADQQQLSFNYLEQQFREKLGIQQLSKDSLITLGLLTKNHGYTNAGALLADANLYPGVDLVRFGDSIDVLLDRTTCQNASILKALDVSLIKYRQYYQHEEIKGAIRQTISSVPEEAFREAVANALVHRTWDVPAQIRISMFEDRIEIVSPGGLPSGLSKDEYLSGQISMLRNPIIANVFYRLGIIEQFGTGIRRIIHSYQQSKSKPQFEIFENSLKVVLPLVVSNLSALSSDQNRIYNLLQSGHTQTSQLVDQSGFSRTKTLALLNKLIALGYVEKTGQGRATKYQVR